jgi:hypothetical protein
MDVSFAVRFKYVRAAGKYKSKLLRGCRHSCFRSTSISYKLVYREGSQPTFGAGLSRLEERYPV